MVIIELEFMNFILEHPHIIFRNWHCRTYVVGSVGVVTLESWVLRLVVFLVAFHACFEPHVVFQNDRHLL